MAPLARRSVGANVQRLIPASNQADKKQSFEEVVEVKRNQPEEAVGKTWFWNRQVDIDCKDTKRSTSKRLSFSSAQKTSERKRRTKTGLPPLPTNDGIVEALQFLANDADLECLEVLAADGFDFVQEDSHFEIGAMGSPLDLAYCDTPVSNFDFSSPHCLDPIMERVPAVEVDHFSWSQAHICDAPLVEATDAMEPDLAIDNNFCLATEISLDQEQQQSVAPEVGMEAHKPASEKRKTIVAPRAKAKQARSPGKSRARKPDQARVRDGDANNHKS